LERLQARRPLLGRAAALLGTSALVGAYYGTVTDLPSAGLWWEIAWLAFVVIPTVCALVLAVLPLSRLPIIQLVLVALGFLGLTLVLGLSGFHLLANFGKLGAMAFAAWAFLWFFEELSWVVLVALIIPWVDAYSVWRGPTKTFTNGKHEHLFSAFSFTFPVPSGTTHLGLPDLFFFSLFVGAASRFGLRVIPTWIALALSFGATMSLAIWWNVRGLPALPLLALGFLLPNADLLWRRLRAARAQAAAG
jgi:hypothetical protein